MIAHLRVWWHRRRTGHYVAVFHRGDEQQFKYLCFDCGRTWIG